MIFYWGLLTWTFACLWWINCTSSARPSTLVGRVTKRERGGGGRERGGSGGREGGEEAGMTRRERVEGAGERGGSGGRRLGRGKGGSGEGVGEWEEEAGERGGMLRTKEHLMCVQVVSGREE